MKKALKVFLRFILIFFVGIILGTFFYTLYLNSLSLVAGEKTSIFSGQNIVPAFFFTVQLIIILLGFFLTLQRIRHRGGVLQILAIVICQIISWGILFPLSLKFSIRYNEKKSAQLKEENSVLLSAGFFRTASEGTYYFMNDLKSFYEEDETGTPTIFIDSADNSNVSVIEVKDSENLGILKKAAPYKDILIHDTFAAKNVFDFSFLANVIKIAERDFLRGKTFWIGFLSLGFALTCVISIGNISSWRIINLCITFLMTILILFFNYLFWSPVMNGFRNLKFMKSGLFGIFDSYISSPFLVFVNIITGLLMIVVGSVFYFVNKKKS